MAFCIEYSWGCRSFLSPYLDEDGKPKYYGRFNCGVSSLNLPDTAFAAQEELKYDTDKSQEHLLEIFFRLLDERAEICHAGF